MNRDDIIRMARDSGLVGLEQGGILENFQHFAALVAAAEREACALLCDEKGDKWADGNSEWRNGQATASYYCAIAIRARGEQEQPR